MLESCLMTCSMLMSLWSLHGNPFFRYLQIYLFPDTDLASLRVCCNSEASCIKLSVWQWKFFSSWIQQNHFLQCSLRKLVKRWVLPASAICRKISIWHDLFLCSWGARVYLWRPNYDLAVEFDFSCSCQVVPARSVWSEARGQDCGFPKHSSAAHSDHGNGDSAGTGSRQIPHCHGVFKPR